MEFCVFSKLKLYDLIPYVFTAAERFLINCKIKTPKTKISLNQILWFCQKDLAVHKSRSEIHFSMSSKLNPIYYVVIGRIHNIKVILREYPKLV